VLLYLISEGTIHSIFRFEFAREGQRVYLIVANVAFCVSTILWIVAEALYSHTLPFALIAYPGMFIPILILARYMNEVHVIWGGTFEDPEFMHIERLFILKKILQKLCLVLV
jgi:hypothetical protein